MSTERSTLALWRTRWSAIGAAVAVSLGAGGFGLANAAIDSGDKPVTVTVDAKRILDTRTNIGLSGRFADATPRDLQVTGAVPVAPSGTETVVPDGATAVLVNVTVVFPSDPGFLALRSGDATGEPSTSTVNFFPGSVEPNAATVDLSSDGKIEIWVETSSNSGNAHVLVDVVGYTVDHTHDDRYYTEAEADAVHDTKADSADVYTKSQVDAAIAAVPAGEAMTARGSVGGLTEGNLTTLVSFPFTPASDGKLVVNSTAVVNATGPTTNRVLVCSITLGNGTENDYEQWLYPAALDVNTQLSGTRLFDVTGGVAVTVKLICSAPSGGIFVAEDSILTATFTPTS